MSVEATEAFEGARRRIADFIHADGSNEVIFTRSATEAVNLVANTWATSTLAKGDEILITEMEHHANIVPWQLLQEKIGIELKVIPIDSDGMLSLDDVRNLISDRTKLLSATWVSNATGTVNPIQDMISLAHDAGAITMVDATQAMPHQPVDVKSLDADFIVFSGHKMYGPTGIGCLWGRESILDAMPPWQGGGDMIDQVSFEKTTFNSLPWKFEAGTPHIAGAIGLGAAVEWLSGLGMEAIAASEAVLVEKLASTLEAIPRVELIGRPTHRAAAVSFNVDGLHPHDVGTMLDQHGVAIRTGHHCTTHHATLQRPGDRQSIARGLQQRPGHRSARQGSSSRDRGIWMSEQNTELNDRIVKAMRTVHDPEIPVNIHDLGLIYSVDIQEEGKVAIQMTLTTPNCPMAEVIPGQVQAAVAAVDGVSEVTVELVWEPTWEPEMMSEVARLELDFTGKFDPAKFMKKNPTQLSINRKKQG